MGAARERDPDATYYVTHRFVRAWWGAFATQDGIALHVVCIRHNDQVVGIAPLSIREEMRGDQPVRIARWASHGDYLTVLVDWDVNAESVYKQVMAHLSAEAGGGAFLTHVPSSSAFAHYLLKSEHNGAFAFYAENPYIDLRRFADFEDFAAHHLPGHTRKYRNKLLREKQVGFRVIRNNDENILDRIAEVHRAEKEFLVQQKDRSERHSLFENSLRTRHIASIFERADDAITFCYEDPDGQVVGFAPASGTAAPCCPGTARTGRHTTTTASARSSSSTSSSTSTPRTWRTSSTSVRVATGGSSSGPTNVHHDLPVADPPPGAQAHDEGNAADEVTRGQTRARAQARGQAQARARAQGRARPRPNGADAHRPVEGPGPLRRAAARVGRRGLGQARRAATHAGASARRRWAPPVIWYVPHPDDETIFMGGSIRRVRDRRNILVVLTRGGASRMLTAVNAKLDKPLTREQFTQGRMNEFAAAVRALGVREKDVIQHSLLDGAVQEDDVHAIIATMARRYPRASHRTMSFRDPQRDHAAAGTALRRAHREQLVQDCVFHLPVPVVDKRLGTRVPLSVPDAEGKRAALREYQVWDPDNARYAIGQLSVGSYISSQLRAPTERVHGPDEEEG